MKIDVVGHLVGCQVGHGDTGDIAHPPPDDWPRCAAGAVVLCDPVAPHQRLDIIFRVQRAVALHDLHADHEQTLLVAFGGRRHLGGVGDVSFVAVSCL